jgi:hypothetical protein
MGDFSRFPLRMPTVPAANNQGCGYKKSCKAQRKGGAFFSRLLNACCEIPRIFAARD